MTFLRRRRAQRPTTNAYCERSTCCSDNPGQTPGPACDQVTACGCKAVAHPPHETAGI